MDFSQPPPKIHTGSPDINGVSGKGLWANTAACGCVPSHCPSRQLIVWIFKNNLPVKSLVLLKFGLFKILLDGKIASCCVLLTAAPFLISDCTIRTTHFLWLVKRFVLSPVSQVWAFRAPFPNPSLMIKACSFCIFIYSLYAVAVQKYNLWLFGSGGTIPGERMVDGKYANRISISIISTTFILK